MTKPYIICHMMTSLDGRIDCPMTAKLKGVDEYYKTLSELKTPSTLSGRVTAELELATGKFTPSASPEPLLKESFSKKNDNPNGYEIITDTKGTLLWDKEHEDKKSYLIITSEQVSKEYISYLDSRNISWISCGKEKIDLKRAMEILKEQFKVERLAVVGGPIINTAFLENGLLDEISILIGLGIDGRKGMPGVFDGRTMEKDPIALKFKSIQSFDDGAVWIRYTL